MRQFNRNIVIGGGVFLLHAAALWALQSGLSRRPAQVVVPVVIVSEIVTPPRPQVESVAPPPRPQPAPPVKQRIDRKVRRAAPPAPRPIAAAQTRTEPEAPVGATTPQPPAPPIAAAVAPTAQAAPAPPPAPAKVELPTSEADYLQNPRPPYPPISKRLGEQGKVVVRVFIGADGIAQRAELRQSSGYDRLDQAARATALRWRYVPGKRGGMPEAMWVNVPINFVLE